MTPGVAPERDIARRPRGAAVARTPAPVGRLTEDRGGRTSGRTVLQLQGIAGNAVVSALLAGSATRRAVQRLASGGSIPPPPVAPGPPVPAQHPGFRSVTARVSTARRQAAKHAPASTKAGEAGLAAKPPTDDKEAQAKTAKAAEMGAAPAGTFDKAAFIAAVSAAMAKNAPKNLEEADDLAGSGKTNAVAEEVRGKVGQSKDASAKPMAEASAKAPDPGVAKEKPVTPLPPPPAAGPAPAVDARAAMPARAPAEQTELGGAPAETDAKMAEAEVTEDQLAKSNEPELTGALAAKKEGEQHSATAPVTFRESEAARLAGAQQGAQASGAQGTAAMLAVRGSAMGKVGGAQQKTQSKNEARRAEVSGRIRSIFDGTKSAVDAILAAIDPQVNTQFTEGERQAKAAFTAHHKARMDKYKDDRYSGLLGAGRWIKDKFADLPSEVNQFYVEAKAIYESRMKGVISDVADTVGRELTKAKDRIAQGRKEISTYVDGLEPALKGMGKEAATEIGSQFDSLEESVNDKSQSLAEDLAEKYVAARGAVDDEIKALQEENKGLWSKAKDAIGGAIQTILKLKDMLLGVLARAAGAVSKIIKDPIGFLGNFVSAVKSGVINFGANILEHLKKGLQSWLFGALADAGIAIPEKFDLQGIVTLILSMLGLTWASIRARLAKVLPEWVLTALETAVEVVKILTTEGVGGLWKWIVEKISDLKEQVFSQIKDFVITKIITAGITWLISLLNPAAAFIKACKMIYDAVMWFVDNASRMKEFVDSVLDSVESIASGGVGAVAAMIESTLAKAIPMVISGLASLLGLGGIAEKIQKILQTVQKPVGKVVDGIIGGVMKFGKNLLKKMGRKKKGGKDESPEAQQKRLEKGVHTGVAAVNKLGRKALGQKILKPVLTAVRVRDRLAVLEPVKQGNVWAVHGELQRMTVPTTVVAIDPGQLRAVNEARNAASPAHTKAKAEVGSTVRKMAKSGDAAAKGVAADQEKVFATLDKEIVALRAEHDPIKKSGEGSPDRIAHMATRFPELQTEFEKILEVLGSIKSTPAELEATAEKLRGEIRGQQDGAASALAEDKLKSVLATQPTLAKEISDLRTRVQNGLGTVLKPVKDLTELQKVRDVRGLANDLQLAVNRLRRAAEAFSSSTIPAQIDAEEAKIAKIIGQTTIGDRPNASVGEGAEKGSSEAAVEPEIRTGKRTKERFHGIKCRDDARGLTNAITELTALEAKDDVTASTPQASALRERIKKLKEAAAGRLPGLERGRDLWNKRGELYPKLWCEGGKPGGALLTEPNVVEK